MLMKSVSWETLKNRQRILAHFVLHNDSFGIKVHVLNYQLPLLVGATVTELHSATLPYHMVPEHLRAYFQI